MAILGSNAFDVTDIDVTTLRFGVNNALPAHRRLFHLEDVNLDGFIDLVSHYRTQQTGIIPGDTGACLAAGTFDAMLVVGCDTIVTR